MRESESKPFGIIFLIERERESSKRERDEEKLSRIERKRISEYATIIIA